MWYVKNRFFDAAAEDVLSYLPKQTSTLLKVNAGGPPTNSRRSKLGTMTKKLISLVVCNALVLFLCAGTHAASSREQKEAKLAADVKSRIIKLGTGSTARIEVKLRDKTKIKGYVQEITEDHFVVVDDRTGAATTIAYPQVKQVKRNKLSTGAKYAIYVLIMGIIFAIGNSGDEP